MRNDTIDYQTLLPEEPPPKQRSGIDVEKYINEMRDEWDAPR